VCPQCATELSLGAQFCDACGARVSAAPSTPPALDVVAQRLQRLVPKEYAERLLSTRGQPHDERRTVTILFSDVKGSTSMAEKLDPEEVKEVIGGAFEFLIAPIYRYEGTLVQLMGDAILAFFGAPIAHEDDPERACRAALEITAGSAAYAEKLKREKGIEGFAVRVGINTGLVVVGEVGSDLRVAYTAVGDAINLAARMEQNAEPGTVLISAATHKLIAPLFETQALGPIQAKGKAEPMPVYRVLVARAVAGKVRGVAGLESPLVGREAESAALREAVDRVQAGVGGIVTIVGEAGLGKSRLVAECKTDCQSVVRWVEGRCLSYGSAIAYLPWLDVLRGLLGVKAEASPSAVRETLQERVRMLCAEHYDEVYPYVAQLLSLPLEPRDEGALRGLEAQKLKSATFRAVETFIQCTAAERPLVLVCEDLHWADPTSLELLERLLALTERVPLLLVNIFRPDKEHGSWRLREIAAERYPGRHTDLRLEPLSSTNGAALVDNLVGLEGLPKALIEGILSRAEGNPFYVEEVIRSQIDNGVIVLDRDTGHWRATRDVAEITIPDTLQGVLMARIDRLHEDAKRVLQMASVIGRIFLYRVLKAMAAEEEELDQQLLTLQRQEMIRERVQIPELEYIFKHELTREAAYNGLLKKQRRIFHRQVAETLERILPERIEEQLGLLAHHWERAQEVPKATEYLRRAGDQARLAYANEEAMAYYRRALALLEPAPMGGPPVGAERGEAARIYESLGDILALTGRRGEARKAYGQALATIPASDLVWRARLLRRTATAWDEENRWQEAERGYAAAEATLGPEAVDCGLDWWREWLQTQHRRIWLCYGLGRLDEMSALTERCRRAVEKYGTPLHRGEFAECLVLLGCRKERYAVSDETVQHGRAAVDAFREAGDDDAVTLSMGGLGIALLWSGHLEEAETVMLEALGRTERSGDVAVQSRLLTYLTMLYRIRGQTEQVRHFAARSLALATERQMFEYMGMARASLAWLAWREGNWAQAEAEGLATLDLWQRAPLSTPFEWAARWPLIALALTRNDLPVAVAHAQMILRPEEQRLPPDLTLQLEEAVAAWQRGDLSAAGAHLRQALELAQQLGFL
jgi:class 3 adenylate cyclase/tetratricopeptide (TPR) repeat protein